jgi:hypothetical protein
MTSQPNEDPVLAERNAHEEGLALFLTSDRRKRFLLSFKNRRLREKFGDRIAHDTSDFDARYVIAVEQHSKHPEFMRQVNNLLTSNGAPDTCFVFAPFRSQDGSQMMLPDALDELMTYGHGIISCLPGRLALYIGEDGSPVALLRRAN